MWLFATLNRNITRNYWVILPSEIWFLGSELHSGDSSIDIFVYRLIAPDLYRSTVSDVQRNKGARDRISDTGQSASESPRSFFFHVERYLLLRLALQCNSCADLCQLQLFCINSKHRKAFAVVFLHSTRDGEHKKERENLLHYNSVNLLKWEDHRVQIAFRTRSIVQRADRLFAVH